MKISICSRFKRVFSWGSILISTLSFSFFSFGDTEVNMTDAVIVKSSIRQLSHDSTALREAIGQIIGFGICLRTPCGTSRCNSVRYFEFSRSRSVRDPIRFRKLVCTYTPEAYEKIEFSLLNNPNALVSGAQGNLPGYLSTPVDFFAAQGLTPFTKAQIRANLSEENRSKRFAEARSTLKKLKLSGNYFLRAYPSITYKLPGLGEDFRTLPKPSELRALAENHPALSRAIEDYWRVRVSAIEKIKGIEPISHLDYSSLRPDDLQRIHVKAVEIYDETLHEEKTNLALTDVFRAISKQMRLARKGEFSTSEKTNQTRLRALFELRAHAVNSAVKDFLKTRNPSKEKSN